MTTRKACIFHHCQHHKAKFATLRAADVIAAIFGADFSKIAEGFDKNLVKLLWRQGVSDYVLCYAAAVSSLLEVSVFISDRDSIGRIRKHKLGGGVEETNCFNSARFVLSPHISR